MRLTIASYLNLSRLSGLFLCATYTGNKGQTRMTTTSDRATSTHHTPNEKPEWAMGKREAENARRRREGLKPLKPRWPWVLLVLAVAGGAGAWYYQTQIVPTLPVAEVVSEAPPVEIRKQINGYEYAEIAPTTLQRLVRVTGTTQPAQQSQIASQSSGRVQDVRVRPGDRVAAGDILVQVDVEQLELTVELQRSNAAATQSQLELAQANYERQVALVDRGAATSASLDQARTQVESLRAQAAALADQVKSAELSLSQATVTAPFAGVISDRNVEPGQFVSMGTPLVSIVDLSEVELVGQAPVVAATQIAVGQEVEVTVDGLSGETFIGTVERINPVATAGARTVPVYITLDNADGHLIGGMFAIGQIIVDEAENAIGMPSDAVLEDREGRHVFVIENDTVVRRAVTLGNSWRGNVVEITEGLSAGEIAVTAPLAGLTAGDLVTLVE